MTPARMTLVLPCYNEARRLRLDACEKFLRANPSARICFVDDGSADETAAMLGAFCARMGGAAKLVALPRNLGKAGAVRAGMLDFLADAGAGAYAGFWDADLATPLEEGPRFADALDGNPGLRCAVGSRQLRAGARITRNPLRKLVAWCVARVIHACLRLPIRDTQCGAKMFRRAEVEKLFGEPFIARWVFDVEIFKRLGVDRHTCADAVAELPLAEWHDVAGSKLKFHHGAKIMLNLARIAWAYRAKKVARRGAGV
ncbi:MAG: glycosyltransferase [Kiritimatiellaeota bacterium]|nr:glycosyltransferase [Kiritimatiellota bacterium]